MKIYFIRHCKTKNNIENRWQSTMDQDLSKEGLNELSFLTKKINFVPDVIYTSPLKRAKSTALALKHNKKTLIYENTNIIERNFGKLEGKIVDNKLKDEISDFDLNSNLGLGVERIQDMYYKRIKPFLLNIKKEYEESDKVIVIVSHSWVGRLINFFSTHEKNKEIIKKAPKNGHIYDFEI